MPIQARLSHLVAQRPWLRTSSRWLAGFIALLLVLAFVSWLALPHFVKKIAVEQIEAQLGRKAAIGNVRFNPLILKLTVSDFTLYEPDRTTPALTVKTLIVNVSSTSLARGAVVLDEGLMFDPKVHLIRTSADGSGRYNFSDVIDRILAKPKSDSTVRFLLTNLQLQGGDIRFDDKVTGKQIEISALNLGVPVVSNLPARVETFVEPYASATINGAHLALHGRSKPFADSLETTLALDLDQVDLPGYLPFSPIALPLKLRRGKLSTKLDLRFSRVKEQPEILLSGDVRLDDLGLAENNDTPLLTSHSVQAKIKQINLLTGDSEIDAVTIDAPEIFAAIDHNNALNWLRVGAPPASATSLSKIKAGAPPNGKAAAQATVVTPALPATPPKSSPTLLLSQLTVRDGKLNWSDDYNASPRQVVQLANLTIDAQKISTATNAGPAALKLAADVSGGGHLQIGGQLAPAKGTVDANIVLDDLALATYQPYVNKILAANLAGRLSVHTRLGVDAGSIKLSELNVDLNEFKLAGKSKSGGAIAFKSIALSNAAADTGTRQFQAEAVHIAGLSGDIQRDAQGKFNVQQFMLSASPAKPPAAQSAASSKTAVGVAKAPPEWQGTLGQFTIADSKLSYQDNSVKPALSLQADALKVTLSNLSTRLDQPLKISVEASLNKNGKLSINGGATPQFKTIDLTVSADRISVAPAQPFFNDYVNVTLKRGFVSTQGQLTLVPPLKQQALGVHYTGAVQLSNFDIQDKDGSTEFLRWRGLSLTGLDANIGKGAPLISIAKVALDNFYARAILSPAGQLNLKGVMVTKDQMAPGTAAAADTTTVSKTTETIAPVTPAAPAPDAAVIRIGQTVISGGNINFTDNFVKPNYTANMTGMNGTIGSIASDKPQPAAIDLKGKIDNDAELLISGSLNPLFKPMFLDIKAGAHGVELTRMTPYAAKYAGYPIIKGKLSMDVSYKIENQKLVAQNDLRIDQLTFGDRVDSPDATKLPVMLAVALLKDRNGQINLNLPISGSLDDPQFSVGGIIMRVIVNLIAKAVTSPFALLNSMFGGGNEELGYVEFAPGGDALTKVAEAKMEKLTKALIDRPALKLDIIGRVDPVADTNGLRRASLDDKELQLKRRDTKDWDDTTLTDADRAKYLEAVYKNEKFAKPKNAIGFSKSLPPEEMERLILENTEIGPPELRELALRRADAVRQYLSETARIPSDRVYLVAPKLTAEGIADKGAAARVDFSLK